MAEVDRSKLQEMLESMGTSNGFVASTVSTRDGIPLASDLPPDVNPDVLALRTAFMQGIGELVMASMEDESANTVIIVAEQHYILTTPVDEGTILVVVLDRKVEVGAMIPTVLETASSIREAMMGLGRPGQG